MKPHMHIMLAASAMLLSLATASMDAAESHPPRLELAADFGWKFLLGDPSGTKSPSFADTTWRNVDLPMTGVSKAGQKSQSSGAGGGFFPAGVGWYRKTFSAPAGWREKRVSVEFDGVYRDATVYLSGHKLGTLLTATPVSLSISLRN